MDIGPGDFVECVNAKTTPEYGPSILVEGAIYVVAAVGVVPKPYGAAGEPFVALVNPAPSPGNFGFHARRFRPIYRPKADLIESLKTTEPELETV